MVKPVTVQSTSSLVMVPVALPMMMSAPVEALDRSMVKLSLPSTSTSPCTVTVMVLLSSPLAKDRLPLGSTPPRKSAASAVPAVVVQSTVAARLRLPLRVTVKVRSVVVPSWPSTRVAVVPLMRREASSSVMVASAVLW
jgi:hypothetical protein